MTWNVTHAQGELLAQVRPSVTTPVVLFTAGELRAEITLIAITIIEGGGANRSIQLYHDDDGTTFNDDTIIANVQRSPNDPLAEAFQAQHPGSGIHIRPGGSLGVQVDTANEVNISVYGITETLAERVRGLT